MEVIYISVGVKVCEHVSPAEAESHTVDREGGVAGKDKGESGDFWGGGVVDEGGMGSLERAFELVLLSANYGGFFEAAGGWFLLLLQEERVILDVVFQAAAEPSVGGVAVVDEPLCGFLQVVVVFSGHGYFLKPIRRVGGSAGV